MSVSRILVTIVAGSCIAGFVSAGTIYKVVNKDGTVIYTDRPVEGATAIDATPQNLVSIPGAAPAPKTSTRKVVDKALPQYQLDMITPVEGQTIRDNSGTLNVAAKLSPVGQGSFQLFMDDQLVDTRPIPAFSLENVDRGEHKIQIKFLHNSGKILASTPLTTVYLHRATALNRPN